jgi:SAM-dependent methyltransferase
MKSTIVRALNQLNRQFYQNIGVDFSATRATSWPGWNQLLPFIQEVLRQNNAASVLDFGCGNGRFLDFLRVHFKRFQYLGIDNSSTLLEIAQSKFTDATFMTFDVVEKYLQGGKILLPTSEKFDLIVLFGVSHHLPSRALRKQLLSDLRSLLTPNGLLVVSNWQFAADWQRFASHRVNWQSIWRNTALSWREKIKAWYLLSHLEEHDYLLDWRTGIRSNEVLRYCHFLDHEEMTGLVDEVGLYVEASFLADGKSGQLNEYFVLSNADGR